MVKNPPARQETWVWSLGWEDPLEKGMATHSSILAWRIPWTEEFWWAEWASGLHTVHGFTKSWTWLSNLHTHTHTHTHTGGFIKVNKVKFEASLVYLRPKFTLFLVSQRSIPSPRTVLESRGWIMQVNLFQLRKGLTFSATAIQRIILAIPFGHHKSK